MKKWRKIAGLSQEKLADQCKSSYSYIRQIECGSRIPSFSFIEKLADALNIPAYQLFYEEQAEKDALLPYKKYLESIEKELIEENTQNIHAIFEKIKDSV